MSPDTWRPFESPWRLELVPTLAGVPAQQRRTPSLLLERNGDAKNIPCGYICSLEATHAHAYPRDTGSVVARGLKCEHAARAGRSRTERPSRITDERGDVFDQDQGGRRPLSSATRVAMLSRADKMISRNNLHARIILQMLRAAYGTQRE